MSFYLALVSPLDSPLFELPFTSSRPAAPPSSTNNTTSSFPSWSTFTGSNGSDLTPAESTKAVGGNLALVVGYGGAGGGGGGGGDKWLCQMVVHKSLDNVEEVMEGTGSLYLRSVDRHNEWLVSAFIAGSVKLILLHDTKNDDGIRLFFLDIWEAYVKTLLNPFHTVTMPIRDPGFEAKVRQSAKRNL